MNIEIVKQTIKEMINEDFSALAINIYLNDLLRGNDITNEDYFKIIEEICYKK